MATAAQIALYKDNLTQILPPASVWQANNISIMCSKNEILVGLRSKLNSIATFDQYANLTLTHGPLIVVPEFSYIQINGYRFIAKTASNITNRDFLLPTAATFAAYQETFKSLFMLLRRHTILSSRYDINIDSTYSTITLRSKNTGEEDNISFSQNNFTFGVVNNTVDASFLAGALEQYRFILDVLDEGETVNGYRYRNGIPSTSTTQSRLLLSIEKPFSILNQGFDTLFDISDVLRTQLTTYAPIHRTNTNFSPLLYDCPRQMMKYYLRYSDNYYNASTGLNDYEIGDEIASTGSIDYSNYAYSVLHAAVPKNLTQQEIFDRCYNKIINISGNTTTYLSNWPNSSASSDSYDISKLNHINQREFLYFIYLIFPNSSNRPFTVSFFHRLVFENGNIQDVEVPYQFHIKNNITNTISNVNQYGTVFYAEVGLPAVLDYLGTTLFALETAQNSMLKYIRVNMLTTNPSNGSKTERGNYKYYKMDNENRYVENPTQIYFRNNWGGIDSIYAYTSNYGWSVENSTLVENDALNQVFDKSDKENQNKIRKYKHGESDLRITCRIQNQENWNFDILNELIQSTEIYIKNDYLDSLSSQGMVQQLYNCVLETKSITSIDKTDLQSLELTFLVKLNNYVY